MQITDPIADLLTRIRNASTAKHPSVEIPASNMKKAICRIPVDEGYIKGMQVKNDTVQGYHRCHPEVPGERRARYRWSAPCVQAGPAHLHQLRGYAEGHEGPGHRNHFHL